MSNTNGLTPVELEQLRQEVNALMPSGQLRLDPIWARKVLNDLDRGVESRSCGGCLNSQPEPAEAATAVSEEDVLELDDSDPDIDTE